MTYYQQQVALISQRVYPKEYLCRQVIEAKEFIDTHYAGNLQLGDIAAAAHFSRFHFIRLFASLYGITPHQYLAAVRIKKAKQLLQAGMTISAACFSVGFSSTTSFTGLFKKTTGCTPSDFINRQKKQFQRGPVAPVGFSLQ